MSVLTPTQEHTHTDTHTHTHMAAERVEFMGLKLGGSVKDLGGNPNL